MRKRSSYSSPRVAASGLLISFEGPEGAGKSTLVHHLSQEFTSHGIPHVKTREPGGVALAESIRELILSQSMDARTELFLYQAARSAHFTWMQTLLDQGSWIFCDRFTDSTLAYQGFARGLPWRTVQSLNDFATRKRRPDLTFLLDCDPETGRQRVQNPNRFELEDLAFHQRVRQGYLRCRRLDPKRFRLLKVGECSAREIFDLALHSLKKRFRRRLSEYYPELA